VAALRKANPLRRIAKPEDIVGAIVFLASDDADYIAGPSDQRLGGLTMVAERRPLPRPRQQTQLDVYRC